MRALIATGVLLLLAGWAEADPAAKEQDAKLQTSIAKALVQMASEKFADREKGMADLEKLGLPALVTLKKVLKDGHFQNEQGDRVNLDLELKRRVEKVIERYESR